jgi:hypothetical protein
MEPLCYLWHCQRMGWLTTTSQYSTNYEQARSFDLSEARAFAAKHNTDGIKMLIVRAEDQVRP